MDKSPDAFRTISEVADWLGVQAHVLRFWESKFPQVKPVKRAGGRRYYRPADMELIGGIKTLLHEQGMTIKGVQKTLREEGVAHVSSFSPGIDDMPPSSEELGQNVLKFQGHPPEPEVDAGPLFSATKTDAPAPETIMPESAAEPATEAAPRPQPRVIDAPDPPPHDQIAVTPGALSLVGHLTEIDPDTKTKIMPLVARLAALRDRMATADGKG
jgi:DNA-binding transcriptional MerR regulator